MHFPIQNGRRRSRRWWGSECLISKLVLCVFLSVMVIISNCEGASEDGSEGFYYFLGDDGLYHHLGSNATNQIQEFAKISVITTESPFNLVGQSPENYSPAYFYNSSKLFKDGGEEDKIYYFHPSPSNSNYLQNDQDDHDLNLKNAEDLDVFPDEPLKEFPPLIKNLLLIAKIDLILWVGLYLLLSLLGKGDGHIISECKFENPEGDHHQQPLETWEFQVPRRFVPAIRPVSLELQKMLWKVSSGLITEDDYDEDNFPGELLSIYRDELGHISNLCPNNAFFVALSPKHVEACSSLKRIFVSLNSPEEVVALSKFLLWEGKIHPKVWYVAMVHATMSRRDMIGLQVAHPLDAIPDWFIPADLISDKFVRIRVKRSSKLNSNSTAVSTRSRSSGGKKHKKKGKRKRKRKKHIQKSCIPVDGRVGVDNGRENNLWYFREDIMVNQHHWYWHQIHPINSSQHGDRRAELFFYMHRAFVARYNAEKLSNGQGIIEPLDFHPGGVIRDGYDSHLADIKSGLYWTPRFPNTPLADIFHSEDPDFAENITLRAFANLYGRLVRGVKAGRLFTDDGGLLPIDNLGGIDHLANTIEATELSVNQRYYTPTGMHGLGHLIVGLISDPDFRQGRVTGVMSDAAVDMRDPTFFQFHLFVDNFFELHKRRFPPYQRRKGDFPLLWEGVKLVEIGLSSRGGGSPNELRTFWTHRRFPLAPGVDQSIDTDHGRKEICAQHLDHEPFQFRIVIDKKPCVRQSSEKGMIRIFMAPRFDEHWERIPVDIQRRMMIPLDSFPVKLKVGRNVILRNAEDSSLTQPWTKTVQEFWRGPNPSGAADFCGCGWPQHLYIPKGHVNGMAFDLFVMVTNYDEDYVPNPPKVDDIPETCNSPHIFCGLPGKRRYPDRRPMGYPFDRPLFRSLNCPDAHRWPISCGICETLNRIIYRPIHTLEEFVSKASNMGMLQFQIRHLDTVLPEPRYRQNY